VRVEGIDGASKVNATGAHAVDQTKVRLMLWMWMGQDSKETTAER
jgi:hypothetical protein